MIDVDDDEDMEDPSSHLGWEFLIYRKLDVDAAGTTSNVPNLASWETGLGGMQWIEALEKAGRATYRPGKDTPGYFVSAGVIAEILKNGVPAHEGPLVIGDHYVMPSGWTGNEKIDIARIQALDPDETLLIEAWDQS